MKKIVLTFMMITVILLGTRLTWAADETPLIQIIVHDSNGQTLPLATQVRMSDTSDTASDTGVREPHTTVDGDVIFGPRDFEGFVMTGNNENGETETATFDGTAVRLTDGHFDVELSLDANGYAPQKHTITVSADEPTSYVFVLADY